VRRVLLGALVVLGLATSGFADDGTTAVPGGRPPWTDTYATYEKHDSEHGHTTSEILALNRLLYEAENKLGPLRAVEAHLASTCTPGDPRIAEAHKAVLERVIQLKVPEHRNKLAELTKKELETREATIAAGKLAQRALDIFFDRVANWRDDLKKERAKQIADAREAWLALVRNLDRLENQGNTLTPPFTPLAAIPNNLRLIADYVSMYESEAKRSDDLAATLLDRVRVKRDERDKLLKLRQDGVKMAHLDELITRLDARVDEIDSARQAAAKRADDIRQEITRLQKRKAELEANLNKKPGDK
jgi:hypothetical protein